MSENISRSGTCPLGKWSNFSQLWAVKLQFIYVNPILMIVHSPTLSSAYGSMREGCWSPGCTHESTRWQGARVAYWTLALFSPIKSQKTLHQRAQLCQTRCHRAAAANSISHNTESLKCRRRAPSSRPNGRSRNTREVSSLQSITIE